jgi:UDP-N-acetyl-2-amino-2-deoxyglucuronate dehydrogenase
MMKSNSVKFAVVGCGHIGKRHAEMIFSNPEAELVALCDVRDRKELALDEKYSQVPNFSSLDELLEANLEIDVINIATPNGFHTEQALKALNSHRHVVVEKPLGLDKMSAEKIIFTALHRNRQVFAVMQNRYSPPSVWIKELVESGKLGAINMVQINCYWNRDERYYKAGNWHGDKALDGGTLFTQFSHFIDIMYWLFGDITNIQGKIKDFNHEGLTDFEDSGTINFQFVDGGTGILNFSTSCWDQNFESSITILAEKGTIKIGGQYMNEVEYCHVKDYEMPILKESNPPNDYGPYKGSAANHVYLIENVVDVIKGRNTITTNALEGLKVVDIIERIYSASEKV